MEDTMETTTTVTLRVHTTTTSMPTEVTLILGTNSGVL
jgi:hypothetical protein